MILLITFIAHQLLQYINSRLILNKTRLNTSFRDTTEPELFLFNESFDANLFKLRRKSLNSLQDDDLQSSFELIKNLNKLYANENIQFNENESCFSAIDSFDMENLTQLESMDVSDYIDLDDSLFNTILFEDFKNDSKFFDNHKNFESFMTQSDTQIFFSKESEKNMCQSMGCFTKSESSIGSFSSTPSSTRIKSRSILFKMSESCRTKKLRSRIERLKQTNNFYRRRQRTSSLSVQNNKSFKNTPEIKNFYKPSFKVEKLLNDSRGMKKYLVDYDVLMSQKNQRKRNKTISLNNLNSLCNDFTELTPSSILTSNANSLSSIDLDCKLENENSEWTDKLRGALFYDLSMNDKENSNQLNLPSSNRCSSGYLSDCSVN
ncbi:unnamed protein product [Brachionus calyciflorus]|uniref:Uncharacterized protein n=1 Tax=Brachionus calyciflorus TaxID=104777 RepID=A0A813M301_9BILA|nr:unnamed protein product [Brachionus calyciflorus]